MKFLVSKDLEHSSLLGKLMAGVVFALFLFWVLDMILHAYVLGLDVTTVATTLYGNMEEFIEPILLDTLLLQIHIDLFMSLLSIMVVSSIYIRVYHTSMRTKWLVHLLFILGLLAPFILLMAYFTTIEVVYVWISSFIVGHILGMWMSLLILKKLIFS